ncbi:unnamed protein product [Paramecium sonneborni]|uniref:Carbonic anhydrase n=1 Tax=Paramecium sonneborni TaxID=65129 RepID=A0A8S1RGS1_9CILI|nr:unnamed protein product [Paramecium sonneborni]
MAQSLIFLIQLVSGNEITRDYCSLPDPIYANGVSAAAAQFGNNGWSYANINDWERIVVTCGGSLQSPIDILTSEAEQANTQPSINYRDKGSEVEYKEIEKPYTKQYEGEYSSIEVADASGLQIRYYAKQFHIHAPSEHTINGKQYDLEIHFVHQAIQDQEQDCNKIKNKLTVFGLMFEESSSTQDYDVFKPWFDGEVNGEVKQFDLNDFFSRMSDTTYYHYNGSLTTPPCSQTVNWIVFEKALPISPNQLNQFKTSFSDTSVFKFMQNNRPIQNLNGRKILKGTVQTIGLAILPDSYASYAYILFMTLISLLFL